MMLSTVTKYDLVGRNSTNIQYSKGFHVACPAAGAKGFSLSDKTVDLGSREDT